MNGPSLVLPERHRADGHAGQTDPGEEQPEHDPEEEEDDELQEVGENGLPPFEPEDLPVYPDGEKEGEQPPSDGVCLLEREREEPGHQVHDDDGDDAAPASENAYGDV